MQYYAKKWRLSYANMQIETHSSFLHWCVRDGASHVLKIYKIHSDELMSAEVLLHYNGQAAVQLVAYCEKAILIKQVGGGVNLSKRDDKKSTIIYCDIVEKLFNVSTRLPKLKKLIELINGFDQYLQKNPNCNEKKLFIEARDLYIILCETQQSQLVLHGDLHHYNILQNNDKTWLAIDPKGYIGEREYEIGAFLRNPIDDKVHQLKTIHSRLAIIEQRLNLNMARVRKWAFCQAALASIWAGDDLNQATHFVKVAKALKSIC